MVSMEIAVAIIVILLAVTHVHFGKVQQGFGLVQISSNQLAESFFSCKAALI